MGEDSGWGYVEGFARYCLEVTVVADGFEDWIGAVSGFYWIADFMQIRTVCQIHLGGCQVVAELAGIHDVVRE